MNQQAYDRILSVVVPFTAQAGLMPFTLGEGETAAPAWKNDKKAFTVSYDETKKQFLLLTAPVSDGTVGEGWDPASSWLFDETGTERDATSIGNDFVDTMRDQLSLKEKTRALSATGPAKTRAGEEVTIEGLAQKILAVYPTLKEPYAENVERYGEFLYAEFFSRYAAPAVRETLKKNDRKKCAKLFDLLSDAYCDGVQETRAAITVLILAGAVDGDEELKKVVAENCKEHEFLCLVMPTVYKEYAKLRKKAAKN